MRSALNITRFVALARPLRGTEWSELGRAPLSVAWSLPARGIRALGAGVAAEGIGEVRWLGTPPAVAPPGPWFGGWAFDPARSWPGFPAERWILPAVLSWRVGQDAWVAAFGSEETPATVLRARLALPFGSTDLAGFGDAPETADAIRTDGRQRWGSLVERALWSIRAGRFEKLVVARTLDLPLRSPPDPTELHAALEARFPSCHVFLLRGTDGSVFLGASPELLCEIRGDTIATEALAGTAAPDATRALLASAKDRREHQAVARGIRAAIAPFVDTLDAPAEPTVVRLPNVAHLRTPMSARLRPGTDPMAAARALHPTPATAGLPSAPAVSWLAAHEAFARGWYAGVVGARGPDGLHLAVGLRAALLRGTQARLFVGAGIVEGSEADAEWEETEHKANALRQLFAEIDNRPPFAIAAATETSDG